MSNIEQEITYYTRNRAQLSKNKRHLVSLYGRGGYERILNETGVKVPTERRFNRLVRELTEKQPLHTLKGIEARGFTGMHVDHIVSLKHAFRLGWSPEQCADISNLQMLTNAENVEKGHRSYCKWPKP
jgi:hypothetical protein